MSPSVLEFTADFVPKRLNEGLRKLHLSVSAREISKLSKLFPAGLQRLKLRINGLKNSSETDFLFEEVCQLKKLTVL